MLTQHSTHTFADRHITSHYIFARQAHIKKWINVKMAILHTWIFVADTTTSEQKQMQKNDEF